MDADQSDYTVRVWMVQEHSETQQVYMQLRACLCLEDQHEIGFGTLPQNRKRYKQVTKQRCILFQLLDICGREFELG